MTKITFLVLMWLVSLSIGAYAHDQDGDSNRDWQYYCTNGTVYGPDGFQYWTGTTSVCDDSSRIVFYARYACVDGHLFGPEGFQVWSGNTSACADQNLINVGYYYACVNGTLYGPNGFQQWTGDSYYCGKVQLN